MKFSNWIWGTFLLLAAVFVLSNQLGGFVEIGVGSLIAAILAVAFAVQCIAHLTFAPLPIPLAVLYIIFQSPLGWQKFQPWTLILASVLATIGLFVLLPRKHRYKKYASGSNGGGYHKHHHRDGDTASHGRTSGSDPDNNPSVSVQFGACNRYLHADCLETAQLYCNFGELEVFFDQAQLSPNGAEAILNCSFGAIVLFIPKHWRVVDNISCSLGGVDIDHRFASPQENAPQLTLSGRVSLGGIEVRYI